MPACALHFVNVRLHSQGRASFRAYLITRYAAARIHATGFIFHFAISTDCMAQPLRYHATGFTHFAALRRHRVFDGYYECSREAENTRKSARHKYQFLPLAIWLHMPSPSIAECFRQVSARAYPRIHLEVLSSTLLDTRLPLLTHTLFTCQENRGFDHSRFLFTVFRRGYGGRQEDY